MRRHFGLSYLLSTHQQDGQWWSRPGASPFILALTVAVRPATLCLHRPFPPAAILPQMSRQSFRCRWENPPFTEYISGKNTRTATAVRTMVAVNCLTNTCLFGRRAFFAPRRPNFRGGFQGASFHGILNLNAEACPRGRQRDKDDCARRLF